MSTPVQAPATAHASRFAGARVTMSRVIRGEWVKFRSLRSSWLTLAIALIISIGLGAFFSHIRGQDVATHSGHGPSTIDDPTMLSLRGFMLAQLATGVLGAMFITTEYSTGMIRSTLSAVPHRFKMMLGKITVLAVVTLIAGLIAAALAFILGQHFLGQYGLGVSLIHDGSARAILGAALYLTLVALLGLGCGFIVRSTGGAIAMTFLLLLVLPLLGEQLPSSWSTHINKYLPMNAGMQGMSTISMPGDLSPWAGIGVLALWVLGLLVIGGVLLRRRDA